MTTATHTDETTGRTYTAELTGTTVEITEGGVWAGTGRWDGSEIQDCAAILGGSQDAAERIYEGLSEGLEEATAED